MCLCVYMYVLLCPCRVVCDVLPRARAQRKALREVLGILALARTAGRAVDRFYAAAIAGATAGRDVLPPGEPPRSRSAAAEAHAEGVGAYRTFCTMLQLCLAIISTRVATGAAPYLAEVRGRRRHAGAMCVSDH